MFRIGVLVPSTNTAVEADYQRTVAVAKGITIHGQRLLIPEGELSAAFLDEMNKDLDKSIATLNTARVDIMAYCCTSGSFYKGPGWDEDVLNKIGELAGVKAVATSPAVLEALHDAEAQRLSVATPYPDWTNERLKDYLEKQGFEVLNVAGDARARQGGHSFVNDQDPAEIARFVIDNHNPEADVIFCSCTAWRSMEAIPEIEKATGKKVITSNQATVWATLKALQIEL